MLKLRLATVISAALLVALCPPAVAQTQAQTLPPSFGFDARFIDRSSDPCKDFYQFACGNWLSSNPIPPEFSSWGRFTELAERNREELHKILEAAAAAKDGKPRDEIHQKIGDYYAACMDESKADMLGRKPIEPELARIAGLKDAKAVVVEAGHLRRTGIGALFSFDSAQDARDAREVIAEADQGGLGLPDRDYYTKEDDNSKAIRAQYVEHVAKMFQLAGDDEEAAKSEAQRVITLETALAKGSMTRVERRDPEKRYNRTKVAALGTLAPSVPWTAYFTEVGLPSVDSVNIGSPSYFKALDEQLKTAALDDWKSYLRWTVIRSEAPRLSSAFVNENFRFHGAILTGAKALQPRWKRCVAATDQGLRDLLGKPYVDATFGADGKKRMQAMVEALTAAMEEDIKGLAWMDAETKVKAKEKLGTFVKKIGYPDKWVDMSKLKIDRTSWAENAARASTFGFDYELAKVGKPLDRTRWGMTPPTVNAYYNAQMNEIVFPAGILQPPFFDRKMDDAPNFGGIGAVIGHEISHGFDDRGSQYDKDGNLKNWWSEKAGMEFKRRAACVEKQFSDYVPIEDMHVNGKLTLGENIGDLGGVKIALAALHKTNEGKPDERRDGFTRDQRFFLGFGQIWCRNVTPEQLRLQINTDPHSPAQFRVKGPLSNMKAFQEAFHCPDDAPMVRKVSDICEIW